MPKPLLKVLSGVVVATLLLVTAGCGPKNTPAAAPKALKVTTFASRDGLTDDGIAALAVFGNQIWAGTKKGLNRFDGVNWQMFVRKNTNVLGSDIIECLLVADGGLWVGTDNGVCRFDGTSWSGIMTGARARALAARGREIGVATARGLEYSSGEPFQSYGRENAGLVNDEAKAAAFDSQGRLWVGTLAGVGLFSGGRFQNQTGPAKSVMGTSLVDVPPNPPSCQLPGNNINVMIPFRNALAIGTTSGLTLTDMGMSWTNYSAPHKDWVQRAGKINEEQMPGNSPMPGNSITALAPAANDRALFVGTNKGLALLNDNSWVDLTTALADLPAQSSQAAITGLAVLGDDLWVGTPLALYRVHGITALLPAPEKN
jgi:ligand-binding sensor domain-containing protein